MYGFGVPCSQASLWSVVRRVLRSRHTLIDRWSGVLDRWLGRSSTPALPRPAEFNSAPTLTIATSLPYSSGSSKRAGVQLRLNTRQTRHASTSLGATADSTAIARLSVLQSLCWAGVRLRPLLMPAPDAEFNSASTRAIAGHFSVVLHRLFEEGRSTTPAQRLNATPRLRSAGRRRYKRHGPRLSTTARPIHVFAESPAMSRAERPTDY
jgi:hypothetical protein